ncbi:hypothetical protein LV716_10975 [Flagellimonas sp. HMM57]|uniref:hypothetical protein n=1 Tax=unclassified Flagellimonas TaxID=2644544 RepID=UPI0013D5F005|nr:MULTISPECIES: hypothetical protein [unclassified Flagellimonas]UII74787.1 hypothetical protein LV716_10975 [Flagellimonas sp. HMM57]
METNTQVQLYPILNNRVLTPPSLSSILEIFYASNQKYFTVEELQKVTQLQVEEIENALALLNNLGDVGISRKESFVDQHFFLDIDGSIKNLKHSVQDSKNVLNILEKVLEQRNGENQPLESFIKNTIIFYSEILDFITLKIDEHFDQ